MKKKTIGITLLIIAIAIVGGFALWKYVLSDTASAPSATESSTSSSAVTTTEDSGFAEQTFTTVEVSKHNTADDCWTVIDSDVYDITDYVGSHPGGSEILRACGIDGTSLFMERTTEDGETVGSGTSHSSNAQRQLQSMQIGILVD